MSSVVETPVAAMADPGDLSEDDLRRMYRTMVTGRILAERFWILSRQGKTHFVITSQGHESFAVTPSTLSLTSAENPRPRSRPSRRRPSRTGSLNRRGRDLRNRCATSSSESPPYACSTARATAPAENPRASSSAAKASRAIGRRANRASATRSATALSST